MLILYSLYQCIPGISWLPHRVKFGEEKVKPGNFLIKSWIDCCDTDSCAEAQGTNFLPNVLEKTISQCSIFLNWMQSLSERKILETLYRLFEKTVYLSILFKASFCLGAILVWYLNSYSIGHPFFGCMCLFLLPNTAQHVTLVSHGFLYSTRKKQYAECF